jgi:hypothetical protein
MLSIVSCLCNYAKIKQINEREKEKSRLFGPGSPTEDPGVDDQTGVPMESSWKTGIDEQIKNKANCKKSWKAVFHK